MRIRILEVSKMLIEANRKSVWITACVVQPGTELFAEMTEVLCGEHPPQGAGTF